MTKASCPPAGPRNNLPAYRMDCYWPGGCWLGDLHTSWLKQPNINKNWPITIWRFRNKLQRNRAGFCSDFSFTICWQTLQQSMMHVQLFVAQPKSHNKSLMCHQPNALMAELAEWLKLSKPRLNLINSMRHVADSFQNYTETKKCTFMIVFVLPLF